MATRSLESLIRPSGAHKWMNCHASPYMEAQHADIQSYAALEGVTAHALGEICLVEGREALEFIGGRLKDAPDVPIDSEMASAVMVYVDYVQGLRGQLFVEKVIDFPALELLPNRGTADAIVVDWDMRHAHIVDLKYGQSPRNKVHAVGNEQLYTYAVGAMRELQYIDDIDTFTVTIVQPRLDWIDHMTVTRDQLEEFEDRLTLAAFTAQMVDESNVKKHLNPGKHCDKFCSASAHCTAYAAYNVQAVSDEFEDLDIQSLKSESSISQKELAALVGRVDAIKKWCDGLKKRALDDLNKGLPVPGWKVVAGRQGHRAWVNEADVLELLKKSRLKMEDYAPPKMVSPTVLQKLIGDPKKFENKFSNHIKRTEGKPTLAPESDPRSSVAIVDEFEDLKGDETDDS